MALGAVLLTPAAYAACSPSNPTAGATVTCNGAANPLAPSYSTSANNLTVNVSTGASTGVLLGLGGTAMTLAGNGVTLNNNGTLDPSLLGLLSLLSSGVVIGNPNLGAAISGSTVTVNNQATGTMRGTTGLLGPNLSSLTGMALAVRNGAGGTTTITNAGTIGSNALLGVSVLPADAPVIAAHGGAQIAFTNTGTISGRTAFEASSLGNRFTNAGTITGSVSMGAASTNTFTAVSGSAIGNGGSLGGNTLGVVGLNMGFAPTGQIDGGAGGNNTLVLQNVVAGPGSGTSGAPTTASAANYLNFQHLRVNSGTWNLQGALVSGDATLNGGLASFDNASSFGSSPITADGGAIGASTAGLTLGHAITLNSGGLTVSGSNAFTLSGVLSGTGGLTKDGAGTLTLSAANTYSGGTTVNAGTLALGAGGSLAPSGKVTLAAAGSTLDLSAAGARTLGSLAGAAGSTVSLGANTLTLAPSGSQSFAGVISGTGGLVINGTGTQTLTGANIYTGATRIEAGTLALGPGGSLAASSPVTLAGGTLDLSAGNQTIGSLGGTAGQVQLGASTLTVDSGNFAGSISGTGSLTKTGAGTLVLDGANVYSGATQVTAGTLTIGSDAAHATAGLQSNVTVSSGAALGGFGRVDGHVEVQAGGRLAPGNPAGTFTVNGDLSLAQNSVIDLAFGAPGPDFSTLGAAHNVQVNGNLALDGATLSAGNAGGFGQGLYNVFSYTGTLSVANGGISAPAGLFVQTLTGSKQINLINPGNATLDLWNADGLAGPAQMGGGSGTWSQANANWTNATGSITAARSPADAFAIFGGTPGVVTVDGAGGTQPVSAQGLQFASHGYRIQGDALGLVAPSAGAPSEIRVGDGSAASAGWSATIDSVLTGNGLQKTGAGTLVLTGANTYTQGTRLVAGTLSVSSDANLGDAAGNVFFEGGNLLITGTSFTSTARQLVFGAGGGTLAVADPANQFAMAQVLSGTGGLTKSGTGTLRLAGVNTYTGGTTITGGTLALTGSGRLAPTGAVHLNAADTAFDISAAGNQTIGALSGVAGSKVTLGAQSLTVGDATDRQFAGTIGGTGRLIKQGSGTLSLPNASTYSGGTDLKQGRLAVGHSQALGTGALAMDDDTGIVFTADGLNLANPIRMTGTNDPTFDTGAFTATLSGGISGAAELTKAGSGTLILAASNNGYSGPTTVARGTLRAGVANAMSGASAHTVQAGATLATGGFDQRVASLSNAGTVSLLGAAPGSTLTVLGDYVGQSGVLQIGTALGASSSPSDRLVVGGRASGSTTVQVSNFAGLGAQTTGPGIQVVSAAGGMEAGAFSLAGGHVDAGAFEYRLANTADGSYLSSTSTLPLPPGTPVVPVPTYRSEVPLLAALPAQLRQAGLTMLGNLHQRLGDDDVKGSAGQLSAGDGMSGSQRRAWGRVISTGVDIRQSGAASPASDGRLDGFQAGTDLWVRGGWRAGVYAGQLDGSLDVNGFASGIAGLPVGHSRLRNQFVAAYGGYASDSGFYADAVLQAGRHRYDINGIASFGTHGKARSLLASIELGQRFQIAPGWQIEPQLQLTHQRLHLDDLALSGATLVRQRPDDGWLARLGVRVKGELGSVQPYARLNVYHASSGSDVATFAGPAGGTAIATGTGHTGTEAAAGATLKLGGSTSLYGEVGKLWANGGEARIKNSVQGSVGVRVLW